MKKSKIKVFICHAYNDPSADIRWLAKITKSLEEIGCEVQYDDKLRMHSTIDINNMMIDYITNWADFVIPIVTDKYYQRSQVPNSGVSKELRLMSTLLVDKDKINKIIVINKSTKDNRPNSIRSIIYFDFSDDSKYNENINEVINRILNEKTLKLSRINRYTSVQDFFDRLGYVQSNIDDENYLSSSTVLLYPVVARSSLNIIHKAQLELLAYLASNTPWKIEIIISDFSNEKPNTNKLKYFKSEIQRYLNVKNITRPISFKYSDTYTKLCKNKKTNVNEVSNLISIITLEQLTQIIVKNYPQSVKMEKMKKTIYEALIPIYTMAITCHISKIIKSKIIVLAGKDELNQWDILLGYDKNIGAILIPTLNLKSTYNTVHSDLANQDFQSAAKIQMNFNNGNFLEWILKIFVALNQAKFNPNTYQKSFKLNFKTVKFNQIEKTELARDIFNLIKKRSS